MPRIRSDAVDIATQKILHKIENYEIRSGDIISDSELAEEFGMSRTPVREAVMILIENGILERNRTKVIVSSITLKNIIEIMEVRDAIEQKAVELIVEHGELSDDQLSSLTKLQNEMHENIMHGNIIGNFHADHLFHVTLFEIAGNQRLSNVHKNIILQSQRLRWLAQLTPGRFVESHKEHQMILDALVKKDASLAKECMHQHLLNTKENYNSILSSPQWFNVASEIQSMRQ